MLSLYNTLEIHMHDANQISNAIQTLQSVKSKQFNFITYGDLSEAEKCQSIISKLTIDLNDKAFYSQIDSLIMHYEEQFQELKLLRTQVTETKTALSNSVNTIYPLLMTDHHNDLDNSIIEPVRKLLFEALIAEHSQMTIASTDALAQGTSIKKLIQAIEALQANNENMSSAAFYTDFASELNHYNELNITLLTLEKNMTYLYDELSETAQEIVDISTETLNTYRRGNQAIITHIKRVYVLVFTLTLVATGVFLSRTVYRITHSLKTLTQETERVSKGDYSAFMLVDGNDEFAILSKSIAHMANELQRAHFSILTYNTQLKNMVDAKTRALQQTKEELENLNRTLTQEKEKYIVLAMTDALTNLKNRAFLLSYLEQTIHESKRYQAAFSIMLLDIDFFKSVNDQYGHSIGDDVLKELSDLLFKECRQSDVVSRYGGEEFIIIFAKTKLEAALQIAERIRQRIEKTPFTEKNIVITISAGITAFRDDTVESLLKRVDSLQYDAKRKGRNRIESDLA